MSHASNDPPIRRPADPSNNPSVRPSAHPPVPYRVEKPWGHELIWARTDRYVGKILHIEPGHVLSLQYHEKKDETIHLLKGEVIFRVHTGGQQVERRMHEGESYHITPHTVHQMEAVTAADLLEASTPEVDDVVRLKDRYGRV